MFSPVLKLISKLVPQHITHRWNGYKVVAAIVSFMIVMALVPVPKDLRSIFADAPDLVEVGDIIVDNANDNIGTIAATSSNCLFYILDLTPPGTCRLRDAMALASETPGANRIVFDDSLTEIALTETLIIDDSELTIIGNIVDNLPLLTIRSDNDFDSDTTSSCTSTEGLFSLTAVPLVAIRNTSNVEIAQLAFVGSLGNAIDARDSDGLYIHDNFIGTTDRETVEGNSLHGICISALNVSVGDNRIYNNIIVGSGNDGIRLEGTYDYDDESEEIAKYTVTANVHNNLIGTLDALATTVEPGEGSFPGNHYAGIAARITTNIDVARNIIVNNGFADIDSNDTFEQVGDGIALLESSNALIYDNFIGVLPSADLVNNNEVSTTFPLPLDIDGMLEISVAESNRTSSFYVQASNACDGIGVRFYDAVVDLEYLCADEDSFLNERPTSSDFIYFLTAESKNDPTAGQNFLGPSYLNSIYNNVIAFNYRNGVYVQTLACNTNLGSDELAHNLPNILTGSGAGTEPGISDLVAVQSTRNTIVQNTIFANDANLGDGSVTGSGSFGIGIDLEDYATVIWDGTTEDILDTSFSSGNNRPSYWSHNFAGLDEEDIVTSFGCADSEDTPSWEPVQTNAEVDFNITENDAPLVGDNGYDPDAGANRLINFPIIDTVVSDANEIVGTAPEGTLVELFEVDCPELTLPVTGSGARADCDLDYTEEVNADPTTHVYGHGQGFRFLGNAYVPISDDADNEGTWEIKPGNFASSSNYGVALFAGGLVVATATAVAGESGLESALCWDSGATVSDASCDNQIISAGIEDGDLSAQAAATPGLGTGSGALWAGSSEDVLDEVCTTIEDTLAEEPFDLLQCLGSTSEFSAAAFIASPSYSLVKSITSPVSVTTVAPASTIVYKLLVTNTGNDVLDFNAGSLGDELSSNLTYVSCSWSKTSGSPSSGTACTGSSTNPISTTDFGTLNPGGIMTINITVTVNTNLTSDTCTIANTATVDPTDILSSSGLTPAEDGSDSADHSAVDLTISPCGGSIFEKQVAIGNSTIYTNADDAANAREANRGDAVNYLLHFTNQSGTSTGVTITDVFPASLSLNTRAVSCWLNNTATDTAFGTGDTLISSCRYDASSSQFDENSDGARSISVTDGQTLHILVTGYSVSSTHARNSNFICNTASAVLSGLAALTDTACVHIYDPALVVYKSLAISGGAESSFNTSSDSSAWPAAPFGQSIRYYIDVANTGTGAALSGIQITDTFPSTALNDNGWTCLYTTGSGSIATSHTSYSYTDTCTVEHVLGTTALITTNVATLPQESVLRIQLSGRTIPNVTTGTQLCNAVTAQANIVSNASDTACMAAALPNLELTKTASSTAPVAGSTVTYTLSITNNGSFTANDVVVVDDLDDTDINNNLIPTCVASFANVTARDSGVKSTATSGDSANMITWNVGSIAAGATATVRFDAVIRSDIATSTLCRNTASVGGSNVNSDTANVNITVPASTLTGAAITIAKSATNDTGDSTSPDVFSVGDAVNYRVTVSNSGGTTYNGLTVRDSIPNAEEDLRNVSASNGTVNTTELAVDQLEVTALSVLGSSNRTIDYTVSIKDEDDFPLRNFRLDEDADRDDAQFYVERIRSNSINGFSIHSDAESAIAAPDGQFVSLGSNGEVVFDISSRRTGATKLIVDGSGDDFCIAEADGSDDTDRSSERYTVAVSQTTRRGDFESVGRGNGDNHCFDLADADMTWARYIRVRDNSADSAGDAPGADIDAVCLLNLGGFVTNTAAVYDGSTLLGTVDENILVDVTDALENPLRARDCRGATVAAFNPPPPPLPVLPPVQYLPPTIGPITLPKTGPAAATLPVFSGLGALWWTWRKRK